MKAAVTGTPRRRTARRILLSLGALALLALGFVYAASSQAVNRRYALAAERPLAVTADEATRARGHHLATAVLGCVECHGPNFEGGEVMDDVLTARLDAPNLTRGQGGLPADYDVTDFERALRHGVGRDGTGLWVMPSHHYCYLADEDVAALYRYVQALPAVNTEAPRRSLGPVGRARLAQGTLPVLAAARIDHEKARPAKPQLASAVEYGQYLARIACTGCHGPNLSGGEIYSASAEHPTAANLTRGGIAARYTKQDFIRALREGVRPDGTRLDSYMPTHLKRFLTDDELEALWVYLQTQQAPYASGDWAAVTVP